MKGTKVLVQDSSDDLVLIVLPVVIEDALHHGHALSLPSDFSSRRQLCGCKIPMAVSNSRRPNHIKREENNKEPESLRPMSLWAVRPQRRPVAKTRGCDGENGLEGCIGHHHRQNNARKSKQNHPNKQHTNHEAYLLLLNHLVVHTNHGIFRG